MHRNANPSSVLPLLAALSCAPLGACGAPGGGATVRLDLGPVIEQAQSLSFPIDEIEVRLTHRDGVEELTLSMDQPTFEVSVQPGPVLVEATGTHVMGSERTPTYFGDAQAVVEPLGVADVALTMFPAGALRLTVTIGGSFALPDEVRIRFDASSPRDGQSATYYAPLVAGELMRVLPTGEYTYYGEASFDGETFERFGPEYFQEVSHGEIAVVDLVF